MISIRARILEIILKFHRHKAFLKRLAGLSDIQKAARFVWSDPFSRGNFQIPGWLFKGFRVLQGGLVSDHSEGKYYVISPPCADNKRVMIYLHGGGYFKNILFEHWMFIRKLIKKSNITVIVFNYPLVPGHTFRDVFISLYGFYTDLINKKDPLLMEHARKKIIMAGDSAGGALALAFSMHLRNLGERLPEKLLLFSPFLDASCSNPQIKELAENDLILHAGGARAAGRLYAGQTKTNSPDSGLKHWMISPFYGDLQGLPDIDLFGGSCEIFRPDIERFHEMLIKAGQKSRLYIKEGMQHVYMIFAIPEADETIENISFFENNNYCSGIGK